VHLSPVYCGSTHDKKMFDDSQVVRFLKTIMDEIPERKVIFADLGYVGIRHTTPGAMLPYKRLPHQELSPERIEFNRILGRNQKFSENFFDRWKMLFRIPHNKFSGLRVLLRLILPNAITLTNDHTKKHRLRRESLQGSRVGIDDEEELDESNRVHRLWKRVLKIKVSVITSNQALPKFGQQQPSVRSGSFAIAP
jgi:hypothetical protein